jgi:polyhydroxyalkanoate synthesis regulator phasin
MSVTTDSGITSIDAGTQVQLVKAEDGGQVEVTDGANTFTVAASQLTNDLNVVQGILQANERARAQAEAALNAQRGVLSLQNQQQNAAYAASADAAKRARDISDLSQQLAHLQQQEASLQSQIASDINSIYSSHAQVHSALPGWGDVGALRQQLGDVQNKEQDIKNQISNLQRQ